MKVGLPQDPALAGRVVAGKYRLNRMLGRGGMGYVVAATHVQLGKQVALKFLHEHRRSAPESVERFLREARAAAVLRGEHVAQVLDVGTEAGAPFIVLEYLEGLDLRQFRRREGAFSPGRAAEFVLQASLGVAEAHDQGIVHRDLKPNNLFVTTRADGTTVVKVLDFGISKWRAGPVLDPSDAGDAESLTTDAQFVGSPQYVSPEQITSSKNVDARTDVWALGVVLYELLTGHLPFVAASDPERFRKILSETPAPPAELRPDVPLDLSAVAMRCLGKDPASRFDNARELARALRPFAEERVSSSDVARGPVSTPTPIATLDGTTKHKADAKAIAERKVRRLRGLAVVTAAGILAVGLAALGVWRLETQRPPPTEVRSAPLTEGASLGLSSTPAEIGSPSAVTTAAPSAVSEPTQERTPPPPATKRAPVAPRLPATPPRAPATVNEEHLYEQRQ